MLKRLIPALGQTLLSETDDMGLVKRLWEMKTRDGAEISAILFFDSALGEAVAKLVSVAPKQRTGSPRTWRMDYAPHLKRTVPSRRRPWNERHLRGRGRHRNLSPYPSREPWPRPARPRRAPTPIVVGTGSVLDRATMLGRSDEISTGPSELLRGDAPIRSLCGIEGRLKTEISPTLERTDQ